MAYTEVSHFRFVGSARSEVASTLPRTRMCTLRWPMRCQARELLNRLVDNFSVSLWHTCSLRGNTHAVTDCYRALWPERSCSANVREFGWISEARVPGARRAARLEVCSTCMQTFLMVRCRLTFVEYAEKPAIAIAHRETCQQVLSTLMIRKQVSILTEAPTTISLVSTQVQTVPITQVSLPDTNSCS